MDSFRQNNFKARYKIILGEDYEENYNSSHNSDNNWI